MSWLKKLMPGTGIRTEAGSERKRSGTSQGVAGEGTA